MSTSEDELARLAAALWAQLPAGITLPNPQPAPHPIAAPAMGPSAAAPSLSGASASQVLPPTPGFLQQLPLASAPPPKESDLRNLPTTLGQSVGLPSPVLAFAALSSAAPSEQPYFLDLAGLPKAAPAVPDQAPPGPLAATPGFASPPGLDLESVPVQSTRLFDPASIKRDFPILGERVHGKPLVWLDNAATTQKPRAVIDRVSYFYEHENSNIHRAAHTLAARATDAYEAAREKVRRFLHAPAVQNIVFVRGATEAINLVAQSWGRRNLRAGDEIVVTWLEHHANIVPWQLLCSETGARVRVAPVDDRGQLILEEYERLFGPRTRLASITQVSNALGTILPVGQMVEIAHRHGARVLVDGAQAVSHMPVDVQALDCDFYCFSGHKVFAPTGIGVLYGKADVLEAMPPWQGGGNMISDVRFEKTVYQPAPQRFEAGTGNIADAVGLGAAIDYLEGLGLDNVERYEHELLGYATDKLLRVPGLRLIGTAREKAGVLSFVIDGLRTEDIGAALDKEGIAVRSGHHCAQPILRRFGVESSVRASLAPYNTCDDIDALLSALLRIQSDGRGLRGF
jgi:cysteine desulfurase/selenocysteine lyase